MKSFKIFVHKKLNENSITFMLFRTVFAIRIALKFESASTFLLVGNKNEFCQKIYFV
jgi:hypothetical protein